MATGDPTFWTDDERLEMEMDACADEDQRALLDREYVELRGEPAVVEVGPAGLVDVLRDIGGLPSPRIGQRTLCLDCGGLGCSGCVWQGTVFVDACHEGCGEAV